MQTRTSALLLLTLAFASAGYPQRGKVALPLTLPASSNTTSEPLTDQEVVPFASPNAQDDTPLAIAAKLARMREEDRQKHLVADTAKLVDLSTRLQAEVLRAGNKNVLSLENLRQTEEIERLARKVRERLKS